MKKLLMIMLLSTSLVFARGGFSGGHSSGGGHSSSSHSYGTHESHVSSHPSMHEGYGTHASVRSFRTTQRVYSMPTRTYNRTYVYHTYRHDYVQSYYMNNMLLYYFLFHNHRTNQNIMVKAHDSIELKRKVQAMSASY